MPFQSLCPPLTPLLDQTQGMRDPKFCIQIAKPISRAHIGFFQDANFQRWNIPLECTREAKVRPRGSCLKGYMDEACPWSWVVHTCAQSPSPWRQSQQQYIVTLKNTRRSPIHPNWDILYSKSKQTLPHPGVGLRTLAWPGFSHHFTGIFVKVGGQTTFHLIVC